MTLRDERSMAVSTRHSMWSGESDDTADNIQPSVSISFRVHHGLRTKSGSNPWLRQIAP
jgi:hypothetical protein